METTDVLLLLHVPPLVELVSVELLPRQIPNAPPIDAGKGNTVTVCVLKQPVESMYDITAVPALTPVTTPLPEMTLATDVLLLLHAPRLGLLVSVVVRSLQTLVVPVGTEGVWFTVIARVA